MVDTAIQQNSVAPEVEMRDLLDEHARGNALKMSCHHIATIQSFDPARQTATATINYKMTRFRKAEGTGAPEPFLVDYPPMTDCPVEFPGGNRGRFTFPVKKGDECLVSFNDRDMDAWFTSGSATSPNPTRRLHAFSDAIISVSLRSLKNALQEFDEERAVFQYGAAKVAVGKDDKVLIGGNAAVPTTLNEQMQQLTTQLTTLCGYLQNLATLDASNQAPALNAPFTNAVTIAPIAAQIGTVSAAITNIATALGGFLE